MWYNRSADTTEKMQMYHKILRLVHRRTIFSVFKNKQKMPLDAAVDCWTICKTAVLQPKEENSKRWAALISYYSVLKFHHIIVSYSVQ